MSSILFVRHGQASFLKEDYDHLSPLGRRQSQALGNFLVRQENVFDEIYSGPRRRQIDTAAEIANCYQESNLEWPEPKVVEAFDEHQVDQLVLNYAEELGTKFPTLSHLNDAFIKAKTEPEKHRSFQILFEAVADKWVREEISLVETWNAFQHRVNHALASILDQQGRGRSVAVFTSVGPITAAFQKATQASDEVAMQTGWRISNTAVTRFAFSKNRFTLDAFNCIGHLDSSMQSYR